MFKTDSIRSFIALLLFVFLMTALADVVIVVYTRALSNRDVLLAVSMAMSISLTRGANVLFLTRQATGWRTGFVQLASALGMGCGTWLGLLLY